MNKYFVLISIIFFNTACATIFTGTSQNHSVKVVDADNKDVLKDSKCTLYDGEGMSHSINSGEGVVVLQKGKGSIKLECKDSGYENRTVVVGQKLNPVTIANVLFWPGIIVDAVTGSLQKYPTYTNVEMSKK
jgi:hypothetical protein